MSKQLTKLEPMDLFKISKIQTDDGDWKDTPTYIGTYKVQRQELTDAVSATIYGANLTKMLRVGSVNKLLEALLKTKMNNTSDNISKYQVSFDAEEYYKIVDVKSKYIDIERL